MSTPFSRFDHHCYSREEVTKAIAARKASEPREYGGRTVAGWAQFVSVFLLAFTLITGVLWKTEPDVPGFAPLISFVLFVIAFITYVLLQESPPSFDYMQELGTSELSQLAEMGDEYAAIKLAVSTWLADFKTLRKRDLWACRAYANREAERSKHLDTLSRLKTPPKL